MNNLSFSNSAFSLTASNNREKEGKYSDVFHGYLLWVTKVEESELELYEICCREKVAL